MSNKNNTAKKVAGEHAASLIENGMQVGLGSGTTAAYFIKALAARCRAGLQITAIPTSKASQRLAKSLGIPLCSYENSTSVSITVDGADEIDHQKNMIKGGGGALLREKILAYASDQLVIIIDESKLVPQLGHFPLPLEVVPFLYQSTLARLRKDGYHGDMRRTKEGRFYLTDNGNYIFDITFPKLIADPIKEHIRLKNVLGVVETGLFFNVAKRVIIGYENGSIGNI